MDNSLGAKLSKKVSASVLTLIALIAVSIFISVFLISQHMYKRQIETWVTAIPQYTLPFLLDSDYFSIMTEIDFLESTNLFTNFVIADNNKNVIADFNYDSDDKNIDYLPIKDHAGIIWGYYAFKTDIVAFFQPFLWLAILSIILLVGFYLVVRWRLAKNLNTEFNRFNEFLNEIEFISKKVGDLEKINAPSILTNDNDSIEQKRINRVVAELINKILYSYKKIKAITIASELLKVEERQKTEEELSKVALQVAHDIRSPLAALEIVTQSASALPEDHRLIIRDAVSRIHDIAYSLLEKHKQNNQNSSDNNSEKLSVQLISSLIGPIITEKRLVIQDDSNIRIENMMTESAYGLFAKINISDFKRVISNIVNNSIESLSGSGVITISLSSKNNNIFIKIEDDGKGIPSKVLTKLGEKGVSHDKKTGSGLGLYHAKNTIKSWDGELIITSKVNEGTLVEIKLPKSKMPSWFAPEINISKMKTVVILDDDPSIHKVWQKKFEMMNNVLHVELKHFSTPRTFKDWYKDNVSTNASNTLYLCDYEFIGIKENGLDVIESSGIEESSILVTSRSEDENIHKKCEQLRVKLAPKNLAAFVPIIS